MFLILPNHCVTPLCEPLVTSQLLIDLVDLKAVGSAKAGLVFALKDHRFKNISSEHFNEKLFQEF